MSPQEKHVRIIGEETRFYDFGPFRVDASERLLLRNGAPIPLTPKVFDLLLLLMRNLGNVLSKDEIMSKLWPDTIVEENNLTVNMSALRKALNDDSSQPQYIETIPRRGYRFMAEVREVNAGAAPSARTTEPGSIIDASLTSTERDVAALSALGAVSNFDWMKRHKFALSALTIVFLALTGMSLSSLFKSERAIESLAVLPFVNGSAEPQAEYLSDGITESLVNKLSQLPGLRVKAHSTILRYKGRNLNPPEIGRDLGVQAVLTGTVTQRGNSLVVQAEMVRVSDGAQIWGEHYSREPADILAVQEEVARRIADASHLKLTGAQQQHLARRYTENIEAYNLYLKGRYHERHFTSDQVKLGIDYFRKAIEKDPGYALAYAGLADSYVALGAYYVLPPAEAFAEARQAATRAVDLDQTLSEAYVSLAMVQYCYDWDWLNYEKNSRRAGELNPNDAKNYYVHSEYLAAIGHFEEAIAGAKRARELESPLDVDTNLGWILYLARRYDEAIEQYQKAVDLDPDLFRPHRLLGLAYLQKDRQDQAIAEIQKSVILSGGSLEEKAYLGYACGVAGRRSEAIKMLGELKARAEREYVSPYLMALVGMGLGNKDQALSWLDQAYDARSVNLIYLNVEPIFDNLRSAPRFNDLLRRVGLPS
jgi:DNA-binding winged helix-turn-helix (wHTH) protein/TolB-like protein/Tfp pilus assembly protein PilF